MRERRCQHVNKSGKRCSNNGNECWVDGWKPNQPADAYYCDDHMYQHGYCEACGLCHAGEEEFEFNPHHLCDECEEQYRAELEGEEDDSLYDDDY